jgi:hypothetical protein
MQQSCVAGSHEVVPQWIGTTEEPSRIDLEPSAPRASTSRLEPPSLSMNALAESSADRPPHATNITPVRMESSLATMGNSSDSGNARVGVYANAGRYTGDLRFGFTRKKDLCAHHRPTCPGLTGSISATLFVLWEVA